MPISKRSYLRFPGGGKELQGATAYRLTAEIFVYSFAAALVLFRDGLNFWREIGQNTTGGRAIPLLRKQDKPGVAHFAIPSERTERVKIIGGKKGISTQFRLCAGAYRRESGPISPAKGETSNYVGQPATSMSREKRGIPKRRIVADRRGMQPSAEEE